MSSYQYPDALPVQPGIRREMTEIDLVGKWDRERILSAGPIDIKTHHSEKSEDTIERVRTCLEYHDSRAAGDLHRLRPAPRPTQPGN